MLRIVEQFEGGRLSSRFVRCFNKDGVTSIIDLNQSNGFASMVIQFEMV